MPTVKLWKNTKQIDDLLSGLIFFIQAFAYVGEKRQTHISIL